MRNSAKTVAYLGLCTALALVLAYAESLIPPLYPALPGIKMGLPNIVMIFLLVLGLYDPSFQKLVFWCFYALSLVFANAALLRSGWRPVGPVSDLLDRLAARPAPARDRIWSTLRRFLN